MKDYFGFTVAVLLLASVIANECGSEKFERLFLKCMVAAGFMGVIAS